MKTEKALRKHLVALLTGDSAHVDFATAVKDFPADLRGVQPDGIGHSPWELLEHLRIAQWDLLEFSRNPKHVSPDFPDGYWPKTQAPPRANAWGESIKAYQSDLKQMVKLIEDPKTDLLAPLPHDKKKTILREVLVTSAHNSYHIGQFVELRRYLRDWE
jgi:hypothetical protein